MQLRICQRVVSSKPSTMSLTTLVLISIFSFSCAVARLSPYPPIRSFPCRSDVGQPLFLTPYIEAGKIKEGQSAARVALPGTNVSSYAGYLTVNKTYNSNMFFWYFPSEVDPAAPVVLWLQGGPGGSSLYGLFTENGPFSVDDQLSLHPRQYYWSQVFNVIYIDNPVGTGYSFTDDEAGYAEDEESVGRDLYSALSQFFRLFPQLQKNDFIVSGESYAGKYLPAIGYTIHKNNKVQSQKINLKGLAIGDGFTDPENMMVYSSYLYQLGIIDSNARKEMSKLEAEVVNLIQKKEYIHAMVEWSNILAPISPINVYNYVDDTAFSQFGNYDQYLQTDAVRKSIHVGNLTYSNGDNVSLHLQNDFMQSVKPWVEVLLDSGYRILFFNGELDIICAYPLTVNYLQKLQWSGADDYKTAPRNKWMVGQDLAGYSKTVKGFTELLVRNAGHMVPANQPKWALDMITRFAYNKPF